MTIIRTAVTAALVAAGLALAPGGATAQQMSEYTTYSDLEWMPLGEGSPATFALLWGDLATGPSAFLLRVPPGFDSGIHAHHSNYHAVVIRGAHTHWDEGEDPASVPARGPGDGWFQPAGAFHGDANLGTEEVLAVVYFEGPLDMYGKE